MDRSEAKFKFQDADRLFQSKQYQPALDMLRDLNREFPEERHILYPMARCLTGLKRYPEAREIAQRLVTEFGYLPAQDLVDRIDRLQSMNDAPVETPVLPSGLDDIVVSPANFGARKPSQMAPERVDSWQPYALWFGLVTLGLIALIGITLTVGRPMVDYIADYIENLEAYAENPSLAPAAPAGAYWILWVAHYAYSWVIGSLSGYMALRVLDSLRFNDFASDMKDVALYTLFCFLLSFIPILGWIGMLIILKQHFELSLGKLFGVVLLYIVFSSMATMAYGTVYLGALIFLA